MTVGPHRFKSEEFVYVGEETFKRLSRSECRPNDIIFTKKGTLGQTGLVPSDSQIEKYLISSNQMRLRVDPEKALPEYVYYWVSSKWAIQKIKQDSEFTGVPKINLEYLKKFAIRIPPLSQQTAIAKILGYLDKKIELNYQINQTLEQMAQAVFKSWFVDFEPVKAKMAARKRWQATQPGNEAASPVCYAGEQGGPAAGEDLETTMNLAAMQAISGKNREELARLQSEQPEQYAELRVTAELFPSAMQDSELGEVPEGWGPVRLERYIELAYGKALKKSSRVEGPYPVYGSGGITGSHNDFLVPGPGIVVGRKGTVGSIYWETKDFYPIDTTYYVLVKNGCSLPFAYYLLHTLGLDGMNTDAAVPGLNRNNVYRLEVPCYSLELMERFSLTVNSISKMKSASNNETQSLIELRDTLLPKLLSGELTLPATETQEPELPKVANV
ncbi:restriction endonuclease subunit S [Microbulbifer halophilus]|uniref:restriction endonuclease subunit S n=1 Tax=Microbulbifer halophilus TaxID=453963 RepID=UPI00361A2611